MKLRTLLALALLIPVGLLAQPTAAPASELPRFIEKDGRHAFIVDGAPFLMMAAQCNNSSAWPSALPGVWSAMDRLGANTLEAPVYWEQFEPEPGTFDTSIVDQMIREGRERHLRLVLLWFGTWKNGSSHYEPLWAKADPEHYPRILGKDGRRVDSPSPHSDVALKADSRAFAALMRHIRTEDPGHTVIMVQVENESGSWGSVRDYSPAAQAIFEQPVPAELTTALGLSAKAGGNWRAVFGTDADEYFHAWSVARYVGQVAAAGKAELALPMYANAALRDPISPGPASTYESGGPTDNVLSIWKAAAPALDALAPDIYLRDTERYNRVLELYSRPDNPLMVPENGGFPSYAPKFFSALGKGAVGWGPFGIDRGPDAYTPITGRKPDEDPLAEFAVNYRMVAPAMREIARLNFEGKLQAVAEEPDAHTVSLSFGPWRADVLYGAKAFGAAADPKGNPEPTGRALVAQLGENEFLVAGHGCRIDFRPSDPASKAQREFLRVEEGSYENVSSSSMAAPTRSFVPVRIWNGDQTDYGLNFGATPVLLRVRLGTY